MKAGEAVIRSLCCLVMRRRLDLVKLYSDVTDWRILFVSGRRPTIGGKYCLGERKRFRSCNIDVSITAFHHRRHYHWLINLIWTESWILLAFFRFVCCHWMVSCLHMFVMHIYVCVCVCYRSALQVLGISGRFSALILTAFLSGGSFTPGGHTEGVSEQPIVMCGISRRSLHLPAWLYTL